MERKGLFMGAYTVLIVDDERNIAEGLEFLVERFIPQCRVVGLALDGEQGYQMALELKPNIILTDIKMPQFDGIELIRRLMAAGCKARYIIISGFAEFEYAKKALELCVESYILKPVEESELIAAFETACRSVQNAVWQTALPDEIRAEEISERHDIIAEVKVYINQNYNSNITLAEIANHFYLNPFYLSQLFKKKTGETYQAYLTRVRIGRAKRLLEETDLKLYEISAMVGYSDATYFSRKFEQLVGIKPTEYKQKAD